MYLLSNKNLTNRKKRCISIEKQIPSSNSEVFEQSALSISKNKKIKNDEWCSSPGKKYSHLQDRIDKVINTLLEKLEKKHHEEISPSRATTNGSSVVQTLSVIQGTSVKTQHDSISMNQGSSFNSITKAQYITQADTNI